MSVYVSVVQQKCSLVKEIRKLLSSYDWARDGEQAERRKLKNPVLRRYPPAEMYWYMEADFCSFLRFIAYLFQFQLDQTDEALTLREICWQTISSPFIFYPLHLFIRFFWVYMYIQVPFPDTISLWYTSFPQSLITLTIYKKNLYISSD